MMNPSRSAVNSLNWVIFNSWFKKKSLPGLQTATAAKGNKITEG